MNSLALIILAAGQGTRMKSQRPKVLHEVGGLSLIGHVLTTSLLLGPERIVLVHGPDMDAVVEEAKRIAPHTQAVEQTERLGTGHAVSMAQAALQDFQGSVLVLYGDCPLVSEDTLRALAAHLDDESQAAVLGFQAADPKGYGRLLQNAEGFVTTIIEELDASEDERRITLCNSGIIAVKADALWQLLPRIDNANARGEFYLTDLIGLMADQGAQVGLVEADEEEVAGVNDRVQLAALEAKFQHRARERAMLSGVTLIDPATVYFVADMKIGREVLIEPNVIFGPGTVIEDGVTILGHSHIVGAHIGTGARIGPFARLRPGTVIEAGAHIGNFVEIKQAKIGASAKINHLSYIGDAIVGPNANIGAGTITCNYDGFQKYETHIGAGAFIGSNTALVAPVRVGEGANIAAGSTVTEDVPADALGLGRAKQVVKPGWAKRYREIKQAKKAAKRIKD